VDLGLGILECRYSVFMVYVNVFIICFNVFQCISTSVYHIHVASLAQNNSKTMCQNFREIIKKKSLIILKIKESLEIFSEWHLLYNFFLN
jgi:hypothetical protein